MHHRKEPTGAHQSLMTGLRGVVLQHAAQGMPGIERIAILAQLIGQEICDLPENGPYTPADVLQSVSRNIEAGNRVAAGKSDSALIGLGGPN